MKKPELLVTPQSVMHLAQLIEAGADAFLIGEQQFGLRLAGEFTIDEVEQSVTLAHAANKKVYVAMNALYHNDRVNDLRPYMEKLAAIGVDGITFGDPAVVMAKREGEIEIPLHWNTETTATNWFTANYWGRRGANRAVLARELSMEEVIEIKENAEVAVEVQVHGMTCMFQSKRSLLGNYFLYQDKAMEIENRSNNKNMFLHDKERHNKYPIFEDGNGTHIFSPNDMCLIDELNELIDAGIDSFKIDGILQEADYVTKVTGLYRQAIDAYMDSPDKYDKIKNDLLTEIEEMQPSLRPLDTGFFFKETVY
ncbi:U32 family peptidase [Paenisporosarcina quisquiliarum]|uniref:U32 family peptidase n=1 Tax=Paenisporosarcina quisquiliarum TaxID=365346 RepID=A0A9X3LDU3_9BACL|nr:peptidase U32 family protein [Paenisporosarcina quisquiliarum]MCZ8536111.1 U32 family peptidase [Paenisporosarcina quisquiliarum]